MISRSRILAIATLFLFPCAALAVDFDKMTEAEIRQLQIRLKDAGCLRGAVDGVAGESTRQATTRCPDMTPKLRIEAEMHSAFLKRIGLSADQRLAATGGDDKTVRIWRMPEGKLERILRIPIGDGNLGKIFSLDLSPDGKYVAAGGWDAAYATEKQNYIYIMDTQTGAAVRRLGPLPNVINEIEFSPDSKRLAAGIGGGNGVWAWHVENGQVQFSDRDYQGLVYGLSFDPRGQLATTSYDGHVRLYDRSGRRIAKGAVSAGQRPFGIAYSPDGNLLAVGFNDKPAVEILDARTLKQRYKVDTSGTKYDLGSVAWSADGEFLFAGGRNQTPNGIPILRWANGGRGQRTDLVGSQDTIMDLRPYGRRSLFWGAADPAFGVLDDNGQPLLTKASVIADMRVKRGEGFAISTDGKRVRFGLGVGIREPYLFDVGALTFEDSPTAPPGLIQSDANSLDVSGWRDTREPKVKGKALAMEKYEIARAVTVLPPEGAGRSLILGADWHLYRFDENANKTWDMEVPGTTWGVNATPDGRVVAVAYGDGTIRWHRTSDGKQLLTLFVHAQDKRWVIWTPSGYYAASPGGEDLIGWHLNRGWDQVPDFFAAGRFREKFYRPDVVQLILDTFDEGQAVTDANRNAQRGKSRETLFPPVIEILSPGNDSEFQSQNVTLEYRVRSPSGEAISSIEVLIDGRPVQARGRRIDPNIGELRTTVALPKRDVEVGLVARTAKLASEVARVRLKWRGRVQHDFEKPKLYALLVGVSDYDDPDLKLRYAAKDARDMAAALKIQEGRLYREVTTMVLADAEKGDILDGLDWLSQQVTAKDVALVFVAGHGITDPRQRFYFLPKGGDRKRLRRTGIPEDEIRDVVGSLPSKVLFFIDACQSGETLTGRKRRGIADITQFVNELSSAENGVVMFASSTGREVSVEDSRWENGAFTEAILSGLAGAADYTGDKAITIKELDTYIADKVKQLTGGTQHPVTRLPGTIPDFPVATLE